MTTFQQKYQEFLETVSNEYIKTMRNSGIWGGDIEVGAISRLLQVKIKIYRRITGEPPREDIIGDNNVPHMIHVIYNGSHYDVCNENGKRIKKATPNGNCLFESCIEGAKLQGIAVNATYNTVTKLREQVCNDLQNQILENPAGDPIKARFEAFIQYDSRQNDVLEVHLPDCKLRNEAIELRNLLNPRIPHEEDSNGLFQYGYRASISSTNSKEKLNMPNLTNIGYGKQLKFLYEKLQNAKKYIQESRGKQIVMFYGRTQVGKSTLVDYLAGNPLVYEESLEIYNLIIDKCLEQRIETIKATDIYLQKQGNVLKARLKKCGRNLEILDLYNIISVDQNLTEEFISLHRKQILNQLLEKKCITGTGKISITYKDGYQGERSIGDNIASKTKVPRFVNLKVREEEIDQVGETKELLFCDLPGFNDTDGSENDIVNAYWIKELILAASQIKIVFVEEESRLHDTGSGNDYPQIQQLFKMFPELDANTLGESLCIIATKGQYKNGEVLRQEMQKQAKARQDQNYDFIEKVLILIDVVNFDFMNCPVSGIGNEFDLNRIWDKSSLLEAIQATQYNISRPHVEIALNPDARLLIHKFSTIIYENIKCEFENLILEYKLKISKINNIAMLSKIEKSLERFVNKQSINQDNLIEELENCTKTLQECTENETPINYDSAKEHIMIVADLKKIGFSKEIEEDLLQSVQNNISLLRTEFLNCISKIKTDTILIRVINNMQLLTIDPPLEQALNKKKEIEEHTKKIIDLKNQKEMASSKRKKRDIKKQIKTLRKELPFLEREYKVLDTQLLENYGKAHEQVKNDNNSMLSYYRSSLLREAQDLSPHDASSSSTRERICPYPAVHPR